MAIKKYTRKNTRKHTRKHTIKRGGVKKSWKFWKKNKPVSQEDIYYDAPLTPEDNSVVVDRVMHLYEQLEQVNIYKANEFLEEFKLYPRNYESLISEYQQFVKKLDGGKQKRTIKRKLSKRKLSKRK